MSAERKEKSKEDDCSTNKSSSGMGMSMGMMASSSSSSSSSSAEPDYFLESADKVHYFFEEGAFDSEGNLIVEKEKSINKVGHFLHVYDELFNELTLRDSLKNVAKSLGLLAPIVLQSMIIYKQPKIGGVVDKHRDSTFLTTIPSSCIGFWIALEDCTKENGCLWFVPGSHKDGSNMKRFERKTAGNGEGKLKKTINNEDLFAYWKKDSIDLSKYDGPNNIGATTTMNGSDVKLDYPDSDFICGACPKGSLVLIHGDVVHMSHPNKSNKSRNIYTFHMIESYGTTYPETNWLQMRQPFPHLYTQKEEQELIKAAEEKKRNESAATATAAAASASSSSA